MPFRAAETLITNGTDFGEQATLLRYTGKWDFTRKDRASKAYQAVFGKDDTVLTAVFNDDNIRWLAAARNAIVHCAGRADKEFIKLTRTHPIWKNVEVNQLIPLNGEIVADLTNCASKRGTELISFADNWLCSNSR